MKDSSKEQTLLMLVCRWSGSTVKVSTQQTVDVATWDKELQRCITSKEKFTDRTNRNSRKVNKILDSIIKALEDYFRLNDPDKAFGGMTAQQVVKHQIQLTIERIIKRPSKGCKSNTPIIRPHKFSIYLGMLSTPLKNT